MENDAQPLADRVAIIADPHANLRGMEICFKKIKSLGIEVRKVIWKTTHNHWLIEWQLSPIRMLTCAAWRSVLKK
jgi:hypothetical protein